MESDALSYTKTYNEGQQYVILVIHFKVLHTLGYILSGNSHTSIKSQWTVPSMTPKPSGQEKINNKINYKKSLQNKVCSSIFNF